MTTLDTFNQQFNQLPIVKKHFFTWAIDNKLLDMKLKTAILKSYNSTGKGRNGKVDTRYFTDDEQAQIRKALMPYASHIEMKIKLFIHL